MSDQRSFCSYWSVVAFRGLALIAIASGLSSCAKTLATEPNPLSRMALQDGENAAFEKPSAGPERGAFASFVKAPIPINPATKTYASCLTPDEAKRWTAIRNGTYRGYRRALPESVANHMFYSIGPVFRPIGTLWRVSSVFKAPDQDHGDQAAICGNWCGPGLPRPGVKNPPVTDPLDAACRAHDKCIAKNGFDCRCDEVFVNEILRGRNGASLSNIENAIVTYFSGSPCDKGCKTIRYEQSAAPKRPTLPPGASKYVADFQMKVWRRNVARHTKRVAKSTRRVCAASTRRR